MEQPKSFIEELDKAMWITKGSRYNGARRCTRKYELSTASSAILTLYIIGLSIAQSMPSFKIPQQLCGYINYSTIVASIGLLILSLLEGSKNYQLKAERLYNCSNDILNIYNQLRKIRYDQSINHLEVEQIRQNYNRVLQRYPDNHYPIDYELFRAQHRKDFELKLVSAVWIRIRSIIQTYWLYTTLVLAPGVVIAVVLLKS